MVFLEIVVTGLAMWQFYDLFFMNALEKRVKKYSGYTPKEVIDDQRTCADFIIIFILQMIGMIIEISVLFYLSLKRYLFPFSIITLFLFLAIYFNGVIRKKKRDKDGEVIIDYKKPSLPYTIFRKMCGTYVLIFYLVLLYNFFIV